jgi:hypothetical protein
MNAMMKPTGTERETGEGPIDLAEENRRLKKENHSLMELLTHLSEELRVAGDFWRSSYFCLARTMEAESREGDRPSHS